MTQPICPVCSTPIERRAKSGPMPTYCSFACRRAAHTARTRADGRYAATLERLRSERTPVTHAKVCEHCKVEFAAGRIDQRFCSVPCSKQGNERRCSEPACDKPHRAKGLCSTHYNLKHQPERHHAVTTSCTWCGAPVQRPKSGRRRPVCSVACRSAIDGHDGSSTGYSWAKDAAQRAREAGATVIELFDREQVFERDGWTCRACGLVVSLDVDALDPSSATVDHVIPLSRGGEHTMANAQCLCLRCNSTKQDRPMVTESRG